MFRINKEYENAKFQDMLSKVERERAHLLYMDEEEILRKKSQVSGKQPFRWVRQGLPAINRLLSVLGKLVLFVIKSITSFVH